MGRYIEIIAIYRGIPTDSFSGHGVELISTMFSPSLKLFLPKGARQLFERRSSAQELLVTGMLCHNMWSKLQQWIPSRIDWTSTGRIWASKAQAARSSSSSTSTNTRKTNICWGKTSIKSIAALSNFHLNLLYFLLFYLHMVLLWKVHHVLCSVLTQSRAYCMPLEHPYHQSSHHKLFPIRHCWTHTNVLLSSCANHAKLSSLLSTVDKQSPLYNE